MTNTFTMWGNSTGYGASSGSESFVLNGYMNTVLLGGADDTVSIAAGGDDAINLNSTGFTNAVTDVIDLGQGLLDSVTASSALYGAALSISNGYGVTDVSLVNHGGSTTVSLGNAGAGVNAFGLGINDNVTLNGDATNNVSFTSGDGADIAIGTVGDGFSSYNSAVALYGVYNELIGGDEAFSVTGTAGLELVSLGNGNNNVTLGGQQNNVTVGAGDNTVLFEEGYNTLHAGTGTNVVTCMAGINKLYFGAGGAGSTDIINGTRGAVVVIGGSENFQIVSTGGNVSGSLGDGNDSISAVHGSVMLGRNTANTATNSISFVRGRDHVTLNGGVTQVTLHDTNSGYDNVVLNGTMLGTQLTAAGSFDNITLSADANAIMSETGGAQGLSLTLNADATFGMGVSSISGLAMDDIAHITLVGVTGYTTTVDNTQAGGVTLHFAHGSLDLIGVQVISDSLITIVPPH